jgi:hypothetical protein
MNGIAKPPTTTTARRNDMKAKGRICLAIARERRPLEQDTRKAITNPTTAIARFTARMT